MPDPSDTRATQTFSQNRVATAIRHLQDHFAAGLGVDDDHRVETVVSMLRNNARRVPGYWIQLTLAMGIATLGLVLDSTAVVIGAMLVSPLMGPIIELGMGFAVGSSLLVMRASLRVALSILVTVGGAALLTLALPFREMTAEIATRTAPTALDLLVAAFCALTASYITVRPSSDSTAAAAGTAVGIALVPPLCVMGFGLGTFSAATAGGAALLFTANLSAILVLSVLSFLLLGYNQVDAERVERDFIAPPSSQADRMAFRVHQAIHRAFGSRYGGAMRLFVPTAFLAMVFVPLRQALTDVTWEVRTRDAIRRIVRAEDPHAMQTALTVDRSALAIRLLVVGTPERARSLEDTLVARVARVVGVTPVVSVIAVSNDRMMRDAAAGDLRAGLVPAAAPPLGDVGARIGGAVNEVFPPEGGVLLGWTLQLSPADSAEVTVRHLGAPMGASADGLLARALSASLGSPIRVRSIALPSAWHDGGTAPGTGWRDSALALVTAVAATPTAVACVEGPGAGPAASTARQRTIRDALQRASLQRAEQLELKWAPRWRIRVSATACASDVATATEPVG